MEASDSSPLVIAHRGFRAIAPENTLLAAELGIVAGAPWWELDVAASSDGELVVIHDDMLIRTTDARERFPNRSPWTVYDFSSEDLLRLDAGSWYEAADPFGQIASGRVGAADLAAFRGLALPTLRQCLELSKAHGAQVNIEIKDASGRSCDAWIVERTLDLVLELGMLDSVLISSFNHGYLRRAKARDGRVRTGALVEKTLPADAVGLLRELGAYSFNPGLSILSEGCARAVRAAGFELLVWTVNEVEDMRRMLDWGATGLFTDFPDRMLALLAEGGKK